ncbi:MAG: CDP-diacylglycerol--glycerol-3-phosphate 3-phosphatidyltransferase [Bacilli bacterium]|nr:CDP-diacylglycerol--glycerol-3-phosphate 3-phosphatidyltransferase [Bacilli bacterium]MCH4235536.1 CDP-diacylglycerol--glycerol-3-phosphate 3-phosphatidyltransferase [Bacilli bacterium]
MNLPNKITVFRMAMVVVIWLTMLFPYSSLGIEVPYIFGEVNLVYFIVFWLFVVASFSDFLDGHIARKYNLVTNFGKFMDPIADKLLVDGLLIILLVPSITPADASIQMAIPVIATLIMIARDLIVDVIRLIAASQNRILAANIFGKIKTVLQMVAIPLVLLNDWPFVLFDGEINIALIVVYLATLASLLSGIIYVYQNRDVLREPNKHERK